MKITIEEIAKTAGVSKATVSRVINNNPNGVGEKTRQRVLGVISEMGYTNSSFNVSMKSRSIGLVLPDITNPFFADLAKTIEQSAAEANYIVVIANTDYSEEKERNYITKLVAKKVDGIILISSFVRMEPSLSVPKKYGIPLFLLDRNLENNYGIPGIYSDTEYAAFKACESMISKGADRIVFISGHRGSFTSTDRLNGYMLALKQYGLPLEDICIREGDYMIDSGYKAVFDLVKEGISFSGILAANDLMALGAVRALKELSFKIPEDVQVVGFDNIVYSQICEPSLSTVQQPTVEMGKKALSGILDLIDGRDVALNTKLQPRLIFRKTTK